MFSPRQRIIRPEILDDLPPAEAAPSLRDLVRINRFLGGHETLLQALATVMGRAETFSVLDVGAASGDMGEVIRSNYPNAKITALDYRIHHLQQASPPKLVADAFRLPFRQRAFDIVHCSLFLHHFSDAQVVSLLQAFGEIASRKVVLTDLERHRLAYHFLPATRWLFRWHRATLHDGPISVAAAFTQDELRRLAQQAGLRDVRVTARRPAFRLALTATPARD